MQISKGKVNQVSKWSGSVNSTSQELSWTLVTNGKIYNGKQIYEDKSAMIMSKKNAIKEIFSLGSL